MRPPLISEELIKAAIREAAAGGARVTGVAVRAILARRHGNRGGVARIYRVINDTQRSARDNVPPQRQSIDSDESREAAIERANLAEHREQVHQARWARETDALRARLADAERNVRELNEARLRVAELSRALASAQQRISRLEDEVGRAGP
jgi:hypothetical protein